MKCQNCNRDIPSGADFCNFCGEKISEDVIKQNYSHTFWGKLEWLLDKYDTLTLSKITGHWIFKILVIVALVAATYFGFYGDANKLRFTESDVYSIQQNVDTNEYYIISDAESFGLGLYIPKYADSVRYLTYDGDKLCDTVEYAPKDCNIVINKGEYSKMRIELVDKGKVKQAIEFSCK